MSLSRLHEREQLTFPKSQGGGVGGGGDSIRGRWQTLGNFLTFSQIHPRTIWRVTMG